MLEQALLIDDSIPLHLLMRAQLDGNWIDLQSAYSGKDGIRVAAELKPAVILLDVDMPDMDGFEVCRRLKKNRNTSTIPVIFLTGDAIHEDKVRGLNVGAVDYLTKPCNIPELEARIRATLRTAQLAEQRQMIDGISGLWNKAYLEEHLASKTAQAADDGKPLSCIAIELDHLRMVDRRHGCRSGDELIRRVSQVLLKDRRAEDVVCHNARGQFTIVVSGSDRHAAGRVAARLCEMLRNEIVLHDSVELSASCSFGIADTCIAGERSLMERAACALERARLNGAATISVARPERKPRQIAPAV